KNLFIYGKYLLCAGKYGVAKILAMAILINLNFTGYGQDCTKLDPGKIEGSQKVCYGSGAKEKIQSVSPPTVSGDVPDEYVWQRRTFDPNTNEWSKWIDYIWGDVMAPDALVDATFTQTTEIRRRAIYGECKKYSNTITITVNPLPEAPQIEENNVVCFDGKTHTVKFISLPVDGEKIIWYENATGSEPANEPNQQEPGTATAYAATRITETGCESERVEVTVTVNASPNTEALQELQEIKDVTECYNGQEYKDNILPVLAGLKFSYRLFVFSVKNLT
ncbi:MAG: hypothetical protein LBQ01_04345, partial [Prevotellaceae bacterium]|nr:hypothetical protein [Prevotellaceae bacterium]